MTAVRDPRALAEQRRRDAALVRVLARVAEQFPELDSAQVLDAVRGSYVGAGEVRTDRRAGEELPESPARPIERRWFRA